MSLASTVVSVKGVRPGEGVSYGMTFRTDVPRRIAVVPAGYADGIDTRRSATYERQWADLSQGGPWRRERLRARCRRHEPAANHFGYSLLDLDRADPFPVGSTRPS